MADMETDRRSSKLVRDNLHGNLFLDSAYWNDEVRLSLDGTSTNGGQKRKWQRDFSEVRAGQKEFQEKRKKTASEQRSINVESIMPLELSENDEITDYLAAEKSNSTANHSKSLATCHFEYALQFPAIGQKPAYGLSCTEGSNSTAHDVSNEQSTNDTSSMLCNGCDADFGKQDSCNHHGSHHLLLFPEKITEQNDSTAFMGRMCKFLFDVANQNQLASTFSTDKSSMISSQGTVFKGYADQSKGRENQSVSDDLKLNLASCPKGEIYHIRTKGTTILFYLEDNHFYGLVDSRENIEEQGVKYVYCDLRKKYIVPGNSVFVVFMDSVSIGEAVLRHLDQTFPAGCGQPTVDEVADVVYKFHPDQLEGRCDVYIGGLLDGKPRLLVVRFVYTSRAKPNVMQELKLAERTKFAIGSGAKRANECLARHKKAKIVLESDYKANTSMMSSGMHHGETGGYISKVHIMIDENKRTKCEITKMKVIDCMIKYFDYWGRLPYLIAFHKRREQDQDYFNDWMRSNSNRRTSRIGLNSPLVQLKKHQLVLSLLEFQDQHTADQMLVSGADTQFLGNIGVKQCEHKEMIFYLAKPSTGLLQNLKVHVRRLDESQEFLRKYKMTKQDVAADDKKLFFLDDSDDERAAEDNDNVDTI